jgi:hypothetical protein
MNITVSLENSIAKNKVSGIVIELKIDLPSATVIKREALIPVILLHNTHRSAAPRLHVVSASRTVSL